MEKLTPSSLGALIALYEHKTFVQGILWNINSFDQWGVELSKKLAKSIHHHLTRTRLDDHLDSSTRGLIRYYQKIRGDKVLK